MATLRVLVVDRHVCRGSNKEKHQEDGCDVEGLPNGTSLNIADTDDLLNNPK
jgi:hypothetical protein